MQRQRETVLSKLSHYALILWSVDLQCLIISVYVSSLTLCLFHNDTSVLTELSAAPAVWVHVCFQVYSASTGCQ